jgi:hypothetical protein
MKQGFGMVEIIIASAIMGAVIVSVISVYHSLAEISLQNTPHIQSAFLLEEGVEIVKVMRDTSWTSIASSTVGTPYYFRWEQASSTWRATTSPQLVDIFTRTVTFADVNRDTDFNIVSTGGTVDINSRKATIEVSWNTDEGTTTKSVDTYIFKTFNN